MKYLFIIFIISIVTIFSLNGIAIDDYHCKVPTCRDFYYGLLNYSQHKKYVNVCYETVYGLQSIPLKYGTCVNQQTGKLHPPCIYALANIIQKCIAGLQEVPKKKAHYYCGYTLMKYCAVHLGLDQIPLNNNF